VIKSAPAASSARETVRHQYSLQVGSVDDTLTCELNATRVLVQQYDDQPTVVTLPVREGVNSLRCTPREINWGPEGPCWTYDVRLLRDRDTQQEWKQSCCGKGCAVQPDAIPPYEFRAD